MVHDLRLALELFGFVDTDAALVSWRRAYFAGAAGHHGYHVKPIGRAGCRDMRLTPAAVAEARSNNWRPL